jgi:hypothetical protein
MRNVSLLTLAAIVAAVVSTTPVYALNDVSYVDIGGFDGGTCADVGGQRCKTITRALTQTNPGGVIYCLTSITDATITITQSVTIDCSGTNTSVTGAGAVITVNGSGAVVTIRGLHIHGTNAAGGSSGINITNAA